jgi:hypothetical protein
MQMVLTPNDLFSWNNKYSKYTIILPHIHYNEFTSRLPAMHVNSLCACCHSKAVKESSSSFSRRLLISLWVTSPLFLCPELTDAPCHYYGGSVPPSPIWRPRPQGPHTLPSQGTRQVWRVSLFPIGWRQSRNCTHHVLNFCLGISQSVSATMYVLLKKSPIL